MPNLDKIHHAVKNALTKDGWEIIADPYWIKYEDLDRTYAEGPTNFSLSSGYRHESLAETNDKLKFVGHLQQFLRKSYWIYTLI